jgi:excisionase family DNA binding protein
MSEQMGAAAIMTESRIIGGDEILTRREACLFVKIGRTKLWELTRSGKIPAYRVGDGRTSDLRYKKSELLRWLDANLVNGQRFDEIRGYV